MHEDPAAKRGLALLASSFALAWVSISMVAGPGSAEFVRLSGRLHDAGLFFALFSASAAAGAALGGRAMDRFGRRGVLAGAHVIAAVGYGIAGFGVVGGVLPMFVAGTILLAFATGVTYLTRLAAAEMFPAAVRGRAVAVVQVSAVAGALIGPLLLVLSGPLGGALGRDPLSLVWFVAPPLLLVAAALVALGPEPARVAAALAAATPAAAPSVGAGASPLGRRPFVAAVVALVVAQSAMVAVMAVTGAAVVHAGHGTTEMGLVMMLHFVGMFGLSLVVGRIADREGRRVTMLAGFALLASGGILVASVPGVLALALGLLLVGFGWSFAYIGATVLVTDVVPLTRRARVLGSIDLVSSLTSASFAFLAGRWFALHGLPGLGIAAAVIVLVPVALVLALREPTPGAYGADPQAG